MPIPVTCPGCSAKMKAPDGAAGKKIKCPKCQEAITVPAAEELDDFEVVEDAPAKKPAPAAAKPKVKAVAEDDDEDEDEKPKKKKKPAKAVEEDDDEEEDEKPKKKKAKAAADDDEEEEEKPKKKKKKKKRSSEDDDDEDGVSMTRNIIMGVVLIILIGVAGFIFYGKLNPELTRLPYVAAECEQLAKIPCDSHCRFREPTVTSF